MSHGANREGSKGNPGTEQIESTSQASSGLWHMSCIWQDKWDFARGRGTKGSPGRWRCVQRGTAAWTNLLDVGNYKCFGELPRKRKVDSGQRQEARVVKKRGLRSPRTQPAVWGASEGSRAVSSTARPGLYCKMPLCGKVTRASV